MDLKLAGKTALIIGASRGIGGAAAEMLAGEGCHLVLVARSTGDLARAKESIVRKANVSVETVPADVSDSANVTRLAKEFPDIDILVNNAGAIPGASCSAPPLPHHRAYEAVHGICTMSQSRSPGAARGC